MDSADVRILLVNPKSELPIDTRTSPPLGLAYLAAVAEQRGDQVHVFDGGSNVKLRQLSLDGFPYVTDITCHEATRRVFLAVPSAGEIVVLQD